MAEPTTNTPAPALPSTADASPYVPVSWAAALAATLAGVFVLVLLFFGAYAFKERKPFIEQWVLVFPLIVLVLCFAARRMVANSEGTRTALLYGVNLINFAWWSSVVLGLSYVAYLFAIDFAIRREAAGAAEQWVAALREERPEAAFYQTLPPGLRQGVKKGDTAALRQRFRDELLSFTGSDLVKLADRNRGDGEFAFAPTGLADWSYKPGGIDCTFTGVVTCPEGKFPVVIPLKGVEGVTAAEGVTGGRQWMIARQPGGGFVQQDKVERTTYGWRLFVLEQAGAGFGQGFVRDLSNGPAAYPFLYQLYVRPDASRPDWNAVAGSTPARVAAAGGLGLFVFSNGYNEYLGTQFFRRPGGAEADGDLRKRFLAVWESRGVTEAGRMLKDGQGNVPDKETALRITDDAVEVLLPIELPLSGGGKAEAARGRLVVAAMAPGLAAELKKQKAEALGEKPGGEPAGDLVKQWAATRWRVVRIESNLEPIAVQQGRGGPPGGPGG